MDITNCRNCGAPLDSRGKCGYCGTIFKRANKIDVPRNSLMDLELSFINGDEVTIIPLRGYISEIEFRNDFVDVSCLGDTRKIVTTQQNVEFNFIGSVAK